MTVPLWLFGIVFVWAVAGTVFWFFRNPSRESRPRKRRLPFPDWGHRVFGVVNKKAAVVTLSILDQLGGLSERFTFDAGPTHQTLLWDNTTVIMYRDEVDRRIPPNGLSVVVSRPGATALIAADMLRRTGFTAVVHDDVIPEAKDKLVLVASDAFEEWVLVFRRHILAMGKPPNKRKLIKN